MNNKKSSFKSILITAIVIILLVLAYFYYQGSAGSPDPDSIQVAQSADASSAQVMQLLSQVGSIHIDTEFFKKPAFQTLRDYSINIPQQSVGRPNPFAPWPGFVRSDQTAGSGSR